MTKQEEIRVEIDRIIRHWTRSNISADWAPLYGGCNASQDVVLYLHSQGVVISTNGFYSDLMEPLIEVPKQ